MSGHHHYHHHRRSSNHRSISELPPAAMYPGVQSYADFPIEADSLSFSPYASPDPSSMTSIGEIHGSGASYPVPVSTDVSASSGSSSSGGLASLIEGLNLSNLDVKGIIEKMGGIDGLVANAGKVQKLMQGFQQLAPMMSLFTGLLSKKGKGKNAGDSDSSSGHGYKPKKRSSSSYGKRRGASSKSSSGSRKRKRS